MPINGLTSPHEVWQGMAVGMLEMMGLEMGKASLENPDTEARIFAGSLGIEVHGSLGIVLWSAAIGHITQDTYSAYSGDIHDK